MNQIMTEADKKEMKSNLMDNGLTSTQAANFIRWESSRRELAAWSVEAQAENIRNGKHPLGELVY